MKRYRAALPLLLAFCLLFAGCAALVEPDRAPAVSAADEVPAFCDAPYVELNGNQPEFPEADMAAASFESYSALDALGRCGPAYACIGEDLMPTQERGDISAIHPTGWQSVEYGFVDGGHLYNRCHLIGFQLTGENANERNLITGTRYMNVEGMLPFENMTADYIRETGNHVLYRVTPVFEGDELVARGVQMEGWSVEDAGDGICFNVYVYNNQPGVEIDYRTGDSRAQTASPAAEDGAVESYVLNVRSKKFHRTDCEAVETISEKNRQTFRGSRETLLAQGYTPCGSCNP